MPTKNCENPKCQNTFQVEQKEINRGFGKFCSRTCSARNRVAKLPPLELNVKCAYCQKLFHMSPSKQDVSKSGLFFCCREHKDAAQRLGGIQEIMPAHYGTARPDDSGHYRRLIFAIKPKECERCGYNSHNAPIIVHHRDRNRMNDAIENLEVLCCNCHAIEHWGDTF